MRWIKYQIVCGKDENNENILLTKKVGYSEANLAIAATEAYDGYTVEEDEKSFEKEPLAIELGGTNAKTSVDACRELGIIDLIYPIGSIYLSTSEVSPATLFGVGTWERIKDRFLLSAGDEYKAGAVGGAATHYVNAQGYARMARSSNTLWTEGVSGATWNPTAKYTGDYSDYSKVSDESIEKTAGIKTYTSIVMPTMPPYLSVYMWKRTS